MPQAPKAINEQERLDELRRYQILDTTAEARFDRITKLASTILEVPVALISLVDENRQWFKSKVGLDVNETPRELAFCAYAVHSKETFIVEDATIHDKVSDNLLVTSAPHIRFYAGVPIITPRKHALGTLCIIDMVPRKISDSQLEILHMLAEQAASQIEFTLAIRDLQEKKEDLERANKKVLLASKTKSVFLANMSHELRTPMNSIIGFTKRVIKRIGNDISVQDLDALQTVEKNAHNLLSLINNIINISRLDAGAIKIKPSEFDAVLLIRGIAQEAQASASVKGLKLKCEFPQTPLLIQADRAMLMQIVNNLLSNAIKYTSEGHVLLRVENISNGMDMLCIQVKDNGVGIKEEDFDKIFEKFTQVNANKDTIGGKGIGLGIAYDYAKLHGGDITVTSEYGKGSEFTVCIPTRAVADQSKISIEGAQNVT